MATTKSDARKRTKRKLSVKRTPLKTARKSVLAADRSRSRGVDRGRARVRKF